MRTDLFQKLREVLMGDGGKSVLSCPGASSDLQRVPTGLRPRVMATPPLARAARAASLSAGRLQEVDETAELFVPRILLGVDLVVAVLIQNAPRLFLRQSMAQGKGPNL